MKIVVVSDSQPCLAEALYHQSLFRFGIWVGGRWWPQKVGDGLMVDIRMMMELSFGIAHRQSKWRRLDQGAK